LEASYKELSIGFSNRVGTGMNVKRNARRINRPAPENPKREVIV
jgi:hypothetical protein